MGLDELEIQYEYRSDRCNLIDDFYLPCLQNATVYSRAVGFFSSSSLVVAASGLTALIKSGGKMRLVASPYFSSEDAKAIATGIKQREEVVASAILQELDQEFEQIVRDRLACLAWLLSQGLLEIKLAVAKDPYTQGVYHEKLGIFIDNTDNIVAFTGSANESATALINNFECIDVFCSWKLGERERALQKAHNFEQLWHNATPNIEIMSFPEAASRSLLKLRPDRPPQEEPEIRNIKKSAVVTEQEENYTLDLDNLTRDEAATTPMLANLLKVDLKPRQVDAFEAWQSASHMGILAMATGAGKTITGLACAASLENLNLIAIAAPTNEIVQQWVNELANRTTFRVPIVARGQADPWMEQLLRKLRLTRARYISPQQLPTVVVGTYSELSKPRAMNLIADAGGLPQNSLLIADEVHAAGAKIYSQILRHDFQYRLGLSATPVRPYDEEGTKVVLDYFGGVVYEFTLQQAIAAGILCEYEYHVYVTPLTSTEYAKYQELTYRMVRLRNIDDRDAIAQAKFLAIRRSQIVKSAESKLAILNQILRDYPPRRGMIYCADIEQATTVSGLLAKRGFRVSRYSSEDTDRQRLLGEFVSGNLDALVAIKCLDEGVDIPEANLAIILASDTSERQFIQRRGRVLRAAPKKSLAKVIDIVVVPPPEDGFREPIDSEIERVVQFAKAACNRPSAIAKLVQQLAAYGITYSDLL